MDSAGYTRTNTNDHNHQATTCRQYCVEETTTVMSLKIRKQ